MSDRERLSDREREGKANREMVNNRDLERNRHTVRERERERNQNTEGGATQLLVTGHPPVLASCCFLSCCLQGPVGSLLSGLDVGLDVLHLQQ